MHANTLKARANHAPAFSTATRTIAEVGFAHATRAHHGRHRPGQRLARAHLATTHRLLTVICNAHALLEATGCHEALDPTPPRAALVATAARILACIDANRYAHTVLIRDLTCLPPPVHAEVEYLGEVAAFQLDCAWSALRPDLASPERYAALTRALRSLLLRWPDWREIGPATPTPPPTAASPWSRPPSTALRRPGPRLLAAPPSRLAPEGGWMASIHRLPMRDATQAGQTPPSLVPVHATASSPITSSRSDGVDAPRRPAAAAWV